MIGTSIHPILFVPVAERVNELELRFEHRKLHERIFFSGVQIILPVGKRVCHDIGGRRDKCGPFDWRAVWCDIVPDAPDLAGLPVP